MDTNIKGTVREIFYKTENGFMVGTFKVSDTEDSDLKKYINKSITFSGNFHELLTSNDYVFYGGLVDHPKYGMQFKVEHYEKLMPEEKNAIIAFLSSGIFPKVGLRTATKIVEKLGDKALELILENYENLLIVPTMNENKAKAIYDILSSEQMSYKIIVNLEEYGFSFKEANKIYKIYKNEAAKKIEENIYDIVEDVEDIGFITVDKIALSQNMKIDDERRIGACILYSIYDLCMMSGNTYSELDEIYLKTINYLNIDIDLNTIETYLLNLNKKGKIIILNNKYYLKIFYDTELNNALKISELVKKEKNIIKNMDNYVEMLEKLFDIKYNKLQKEAIQTCLENNITIITGGPGTGKTTIIKAIVELYRNINKLTDEKLLESIVLLAPTGRAAKRIKEATGFPASTIHKFLKWNKETNEFSINKHNKSNAKFAIVDESSMIDNLLFKNLLDGLSNDIKLVIVGDHNQLPSVLPGQVLKDLIDSNIVPVIELNELYRQKEDSYIVSLAHEIKEGNLSENCFKKRSDYSFIECSKYDIEKMITELCKKAIEKNYSYKELQVLVPMYKGINGIDNLNKKLQDIFNPKSDSKNEIEYFGTRYREGDKVLQIKNVSDYDVSNGDIGIIDYIGNEKDNYRIVIDFDGELIDYTKADFEFVRLGYAISIHKAQGSEFDIVVIPMDLAFSRMLYRKLIYTAVTRAKKSLTLIGEKEALSRSVENIKEESRKTTLKDMIIKHI
jgi:exodeoxyribonuclease V alpha subunit